MQSGIYTIINCVNQHQYIGSSKRINIRWDQHRYALKKNKHHNAYLQNAWNLYGPENFQFLTLEYCDIDLLLFYEKYYINKFKPTYNIREVTTEAVIDSYIGNNRLERDRNQKWVNSHLLLPIEEIPEKSYELFLYWKDIFSLPLILQETLILSKVLGMNHREIGKILGISPDNVRARISRAYTKLSAEARR